MTIEYTPTKERLRQRYPQVLTFYPLMLEQLYANRSKGDRKVWMQRTASEHAYDASWHLIKLMAAIKDNDPLRMREHAADVANIMMMALDSADALEAE